MEYPYANKILELISEDEKAEESVAFHGMSLEALEYAAKTGKINGAPKQVVIKGNVLAEKGDLFFYPNLKTFPFEMLPEIEPHINHKLDNYQRAVGYAKDNAMLHGFLSELHIPLDNRELNYHEILEYYLDEDDPELSVEAARSLLRLKELVQNEDLTYLVNQGFTLSQIERAVLSCNRRYGFTTGLSKSFLEDYPIKQGDLEEDIRIHESPEGTSLKYFTFFRPHGPVERLFLNMLKYPK